MTGTWRDCFINILLGQAWEHWSLLLQYIQGTQQEDCYNCFTLGHKTYPYLRLWNCVSVANYITSFSLISTCRNCFINSLVEKERKRSNLWLQYIKVHAYFLTMFNGAVECDYLEKCTQHSDWSHIFKFMFPTLQETIQFFHWIWVPSILWS